MAEGDVAGVVAARRCAKEEAAWACPWSPGGVLNINPRGDGRYTRQGGRVLGSLQEGPPHAAFAIEMHLYMLSVVDLHLDAVQEGGQSLLTRSPALSVHY